MTTYALTEKEVSALHNARCYLLNALEHCNEMFKEDANFVKQMKLSLDYLNPVASRVMKIKDQIHEDRWERSKRIAKLNDFKHSIWSMYVVDNFEDISTVPVGAKLCSFYTDQTVTVEGPTWLDLWKATEKLIEMTRDDHGDHVFIESFDKVKNKDNLYEVSLGS